jgi:hypothetical protein
MLEAGDWRVQEELDAACQRANIPLLIRPDPHFLCSLDDFNAWAGEKSSLRLEFFYRWQRKRHDILMADGEPVGGQWNFDADNRQSFGKKGPGLIPAPERFALDAMTREVMALVEQHFPDHPGQLANFAWPVTPEQARQALDDFIRHRLPEFGRWQDAMWGHEPFLWHSLLSTAMNLKLLDPRTVIAATLAAYQAGNVPLAAAEGFIRQILGWREFVRGIYWRQMPGLAEANQYDHKVALPDWFWTGKTQRRLPRRRHRPNPATRLRPPYSTPDDHRQLRADRRHRAASGSRLVSRDLRRRRRLGRRTQHPGHGAQRLARHDQQALLRIRRLHQAHEQPLPDLPLPARNPHRRSSLPIHHVLLGFFASPRRTLCAEPAHGTGRKKHQPFSGRGTPGYSASRRKTARESG